MSAEGADTDFCMCGHSRGRHNHVHSKAVKFCWAAGCSCSEFDLRSDRAPVVDSAALPTQLAQPTGRRASSIACIYIAGAYTAPDAWGVEQNVRRAESLAYEVAKLGAMPVCPHTNLRYMCYEIATFMYPATLELMRRCDAVLMVEGWEQSTGACGEYEEAGLLKMPRFWTLNGLRGWLSARGKRDGGA